MQYTVSYLRMVILSIPFSLYATTLYNQLRLCGNVKDGMLGMLAGMLLNMILDPILILGAGMNAAGAGLATTIGQVVGAAALTWLSFLHGNIPVSLRHGKLGGGRLYHILLGGLPNFTRQGITSLASVLLNQAAAPYGAGVLAALTVSSRVAALAYLLMIGFGQGFQPICAMNYGAKAYDRVRKAFRMTVGIGTIFLAAAAVLIYLAAGRLTGIFTTDPEVLETGSRILRYQCISLPFLSFYAVSSMYMQNIGRYFRALFISVSRQGIFYIPLVLILPHLWGVQGIYVLQPAADLLSFAVALGVIAVYEKCSDDPYPAKSQDRFTANRNHGKL